MSKKNPIQEINSKIEKLQKEKQDFLEKQERKTMRILRKSWGDEILGDPIISDVIEQLKEAALSKYEELKVKQNDDGNKESENE